jgi:hypothetical protein
MSVHPYWAIVLSVIGLALIWLAAVAVWNAIVTFLASPWCPNQPVLVSYGKVQESHLIVA